MSSHIPDTQRAWVNVTRGTPPQALLFKDDWPVPKKLAPGEVLVQIQAAALNPVGYKLMRVLPNFAARRPRIPEFDLAGVVVDANGSRFSNGDHVFGWIPSSNVRDHDQGTLAQYARVPADALINRPPNITPTQAAGLTLTGLTAYKAVVTTADIQPGQRIFINGGSTSVGAFAIQIAKIKGAHVTASASSKNEEYVRGLGADEFVDYTKVSLPEYLREKGRTAKFDYILEAVGLSDPSLYTESDAYLSPMGAFMSVGPQPKGISLSEFWNIGKTLFAMFRPRILGGNKAQFINFVALNDQKGLQLLHDSVANGSIKPKVDSVFDFDKALEAYDRLQSSRAVGKVVIKVDPSVE
ncbi:NAD(P)-binding protein [Agrocybe pediades]|nr:NAD(P)-binding protein [Agrocybe pediades]